MVPPFPPVLPCGAAYSRKHSTLSKRLKTMKAFFNMILLWIGLAVLLPFPCYAEISLEELVAAIIQQESGGNPLAINVAGKAYFPKTLEEAEGIIANAQSAKKSFDVGLMQVNSWWMNKFNIPANSLLDEETNLFWGKWILNQEINRHGFNWVAVGKYHSPSVERGKNYAWNVYSKLTGKGKSHAYKKDTSKNLPDRSGVWRNPSVQPQGRIIRF